MTFTSILFLSLGLAMDATAVAATRGLAVEKIFTRHVVLVAVFFGGFQALMPLIGWFVGARVGPAVASYDHGIAFVLLAAIGGKMLYEAWSADGDEPQKTNDPFGLKVMTVLAFATSIDALAVGVTLPILRAPLLLSITTIGVTTALLSAVGLFAGRHFSKVLGKRLDIAGGVVLIALGTKILIEHLRA